MLIVSRKIYGLTRCAIALCAFIDWTHADEIDPPQFIHGLAEVRHLSELPHEVAKALGWQGIDKDGIADLELKPGTSSPKSIDRWFLLGGLSKTYALIAIVNRRVYPSFDRFHVSGFTLAGSLWVPSGEWVISSLPHTVDELGQLLGSPESQVITARWRNWQHERELDRRLFGSSSALSYRANAPLRKININDEEVRQIEAVVHELKPGAIVLISGVVEGCPCEDGPGCSAQVWTAIERAEGIRSLELSDINDHWIVGPVQRWYLELAQLERSKFPTYAAYTTAHATLSNRYPTCSTGPSTAH
jgi:hypothetical protein